MELTNELNNTHHQVNLLAKDRDGKTILLVEIKAQKLEVAHRECLLLYMQQSNLQYFLQISSLDQLFVTFFFQIGITS
ncbi:MAG: hypothetical protein QNJ68_05535 [Microcoleaceae cyanobacterium MO_207.B10]|nr:hypothetical protein [Microcoleaceae cyanobacterium MO_207.B10]